MKLKCEDYIGKRFSNLVVVGLDNSRDHFNSNHWIFLCDCGKEFSDYPSRVLSGHKKSCGCQKGKSSLVHGCNGDEFYPTWWGMMRRCYNKESHNYERYGGRGIAVCEEWHDPKAFIQWARETIGHKEIGLTLDRADNNKGYSPENCKWSTAKSQANNKRNNTLYTINGQTKTITQWCEYYKINKDVVLVRIHQLGWPVEVALKTPLKKVSKQKAAR